MKRLISVFLLFAMAFSLASCGKTTDSGEMTNLVEIVMEDGGSIKIQLYEDVAPVTVANFKKLVSEGFYDGLIFHRVISGFMIQGGDPTGTGSGGSSKNIKGEFLSNGFDNTLSHERGVVSMARSEDYNSASSQFFICHADSAHLDGDYAAFGKVVEGMEVVDAIASAATDSNNRPVVDQVIKTIRFINESDIGQTETEIDATVTDVVEIEMENGGIIKLELYGEVAPITVANFKKLISEGFYDGLIFHRVIADFMIQGGDPTGTGTGGSEEKITGEFTANGIENDISHIRGVISMARSSDYNSASSQFFICHADSNHLDGQYAAFGRVIEGMEVVDDIASVQTGANDKPLVDQVIKTIRIVEEKETNG